MKKSTEQSAQKMGSETEQKGFWTEVFFTEGGASLLIIFPLTVLYFLVRAIS